MIFNLIKKSFNSVVDNPSITLYLVLFLIVLNFLTFYMMQTSAPVAKITFLIATLLLIFAFTSGWLQVIKESIDVKKIKEKNFFSIFVEGVGKNIIPVSLGLIIYTILLMFVIFIASIVAGVLFGNLDFIINDILNIAQSSSNPNDFLNNLNDNQKYILYAWQLSFIATITIFNFIFLFYLPILLKENNKNIFLKPFVAVFENICFLFKNFLNAFIMFVSICCIYFLIAISRALILNGNFSAVLNNFSIVLILFIYIYFISTAIMLIFNYHEQKNLCNNRTDCIGQNESGDSVSKQN